MFNEAINNINSKGGDIESNAAIVGGMIAATQEITEDSKLLENIDLKFFEEAPSILEVVWSGKKYNL
jgi:hypothetical protein